MVIKFIDNNFVDSYYPTIESTFSKSINHKGTEYECDIIDTAGQVSFNYPPTPPSPTPAFDARNTLTPLVARMSTRY